MVLPLKVSAAAMLAALPRPATPRWPDGVWHAEALRHGTMSAEIFAPKGSDHQTPHDQDEIYVVVSGSGAFRRETETVAFGPGDLLFVPAGMDHRFERFSDDFAAWVVFWGPAGGEAA